MIIWNKLCMQACLLNKILLEQCCNGLQKSWFLWFSAASFSEEQYRIYQLLRSNGSELLFQPRGSWYQPPLLVLSSHWCTCSNNCPNPWGFGNPFVWEVLWGWMETDPPQSQLRFFSCLWTPETSCRGFHHGVAQPQRRTGGEAAETSPALLQIQKWPKCPDAAQAAPERAGSGRTASRVRSGHHLWLKDRFFCYLMNWWRWQTFMVFLCSAHTKVCNLMVMSHERQDQNCSYFYHQKPLLKAGKSEPTGYHNGLRKIPKQCINPNFQSPSIHVWEPESCGWDHPKTNWPRASYSQRMGTTWQYLTSWKRKM